MYITRWKSRNAVDNRSSDDVVTHDFVVLNLLTSRTVSSILRNMVSVALIHVNIDQQNFATLVAMLD